MAKTKGGARPVRTVRTQPARAGGSGSQPPRRTWLDAPPPRTDGFPGDRLGYPQTGRGSMATQGAKLGALLIDLLVSGVVAFIAVRPRTPHQFQVSNAIADGVFVLLTTALLVASGRTVGMRALGLQVVRFDGRTMGWRSLPRQVLVAVLVPALIVNRDRRGLHDQWLRTAVVNVR